MALSVTKQQEWAIRDYARRHGRHWKKNLKLDWNGAAVREGSTLRALRNSHGFDWLRRYKVELPSLTVEGNKGGSYVTIKEAEEEGVVYVEVGHDCVQGVSEHLSVYKLAEFLVRHRDELREAANQLLDRSSDTII